MFSVHGHAAPALLAVLLVLHHEVAPEVLHAPPLALDAGVGHQQRGVVAQVEILAMPRFREETARSVTA